MTKIIDNDGNELEVNLSSDEIIKLQEDRQQIVKKQEELDKLSKEHEDNKVELEKLRKKNYDYSALRSKVKGLKDMSEDEKSKLSAREHDLMIKQEEIELQHQELKKNQDSFQNNIIDQLKKEALSVLCGTDTELQKQVELNYDRINDPAVSKEDIYKKMRDALNMTGKPSTDNYSGTISVSNAFGHTGQAVKRLSSDKKVDKDLASRLGIGEDVLKKYGY